MKKLYLFISLSIIAQYGFCQFVSVPINYTHDGSLHSPNIISIVDENNVWVGTQRQDFSTFFMITYSTALKTNDGGNTWQFSPIPTTGNPFIVDVEAKDENECYYLLTDLNSGGSSVWKTVDGGTTWSKKTTTEFTGGFADFIHLIGPDTLIAVGDPTNGYFNIQISNDGGDTWTRIPQANIPAVLLMEEAVGGKSFSSIGNTIWFASSSGRCFKSVNRGYNWTVSVLDSTAETANAWSVCFSDSEHGIFYCKNGYRTKYFKTNDGGDTWTRVYFLQHLYWPGISRIDGIYDGFIICAKDTTFTRYTYIYYTNDFFSTLTPLDTVSFSSDYVYFKNATTGWLSGSFLPDSNNIFKFAGVLTAIHDKGDNQEQLSIFPNPTIQDVIITLPSGILGQRKIFRIYDLTGKMVKEDFLEQTVKSIRINSSKYPNGLYVISLISDNAVVKSARWVISH